jgi:hypothetical protein
VTGEVLTLVISVVTLIVTATGVFRDDFNRLLRRLRGGSPPLRAQQPGRLWTALFGAALVVALSSGYVIATTQHPGPPCKAKGPVPPAYTTLDPAYFPEHDTPDNKDAPPDLRAAWRGYGVTLIPSRHVLDDVPQAPPVRNLTNGAVCDSDAQALLQADFRVDGYVGWLGENVQLGFNPHLRTDAYLAPGNKVGDALRAGHQVIDPPCDRYAVRAALIPVDDTLRTFFWAHQRQTTTSSYALVEYFSSPLPCVVVEITPTGPMELIPLPVEGTIVIETGGMRGDRVLGDIWFTDAVGSCRPGATLPVCQAVQAGTAEVSQDTSRMALSPADPTQGPRRDPSVAAQPATSRRMGRGLIGTSGRVIANARYTSRPVDRRSCRADAQRRA